MVHCAQLLVDSEKDVLEDILHIRFIVDPSSDKRVQLVMKFIPKPFRLVSHSLLPHLQPQVAESAVPQHDAFSDGSQQDTSSTGGQHNGSSATVCCRLPEKKRFRFSGTSSKGTAAGADT